MKLKTEHQEDGKFAMYKALKTDAERRDWLASFIIDSSCGSCEATASTTVSKSNVEQGEGQWVTESQLAGPLFLNDAQHATVTVKRLISRPHEDPELAADDVKQYWYVKETVQVGTSVNDAVTARTTAELSAEDYEVVRDVMTDL